MNRLQRATTAAVLLLSGCGFGKPPFSLHEGDGLVTVDVQTLGEYQTSISRIEVTEAETGRTLWKVLPTGSHFQIHTFQLKAGANDARLETAWGHTRAVVPHGEASFFLHPGSIYQVEVCGKRCRSGTFRLKPKT